MRRALRPLIVAALMVVALPGAAHAATVDHDTTTGLIEILDSGANADDIVVEQTSMFVIITQHGAGGLANDPFDDCTEEPPDTPPDVVQCPRLSKPAFTSLSVDLGGGNDKFHADGITDPVSVSGGDGNDDISTGAGNDVLAGGTGNDKLNG